MPASVLSYRFIRNVLVTKKDVSATVFVNPASEDFSSFYTDGYIIIRYYAREIVWLHALFLH